MNEMIDLQKITLLDTMYDDEAPVISAQADFIHTRAKPIEACYLRPDVPQETSKECIEFMLSQAPQRDGNFIVIPNVL